MRILILGCDKVVAHLVADLAQEGGHRITVMDEASDCLEGLPQSENVAALLTAEPIIEHLRRVGINHVDAFLALSDDDNKNAMAAQVASHIFHVQEVICRIGDPLKETMYRELGMNVIGPTPVLRDAINRTLKGTP